MNTELRKRKATVVRSGLKCLDCGQGLTFISGHHVLTFHCPLGHSWDLQELIDRHQTSVDDGLQTILAAWREKIKGLESTIQRAGQSGFPEVAETFRHELNRLQWRVGLLTGAIGSDN